jgi:hypothetical protein
VNENLKQAAIRLGQNLSGNPWYSIVGVAEEAEREDLIIYLRRLPPNGGKGIPKEWEGMPVRLQSIGKAVAL